jgi:uncharacterized protein (TIGR02145 family)
MKLLKISMALSVAALFTACDETSSVVEATAAKTETYTSKDSIPDCDKDYEGQFAFVSSKKEMYVCSEGEWIDMVGKTTETAEKLSCKTEELKDKTGLKIVCNGDSIGVVKNGTKGEAGVAGSCTVEDLADKSGVKVTCGDKSVVVANGDPGEPGNPGNPGKPGEPGLGYDEEELKNRCKETYAGYDVVIYNCDGTTYTTVLKQTEFPTWNGLSTNANVGCDEYALIDDGRLRVAPEILTRAVLEENPCLGFWGFDGNIEWDNVTSTSPSPDEILQANYGFTGVSKSVGDLVYLEFNEELVDLTNNGGLCITYSSEKDMDIGIFGDSPYYLQAVLPATDKKEKTLNLLWKDFEETANSLRKASASQYGKWTLSEAYGIGITTLLEEEPSSSSSSNSNAFGIYEFGAYGKCTGMTRNSADKNKDTFTDTRDKKEYKTVTVGDQIWMAENMAYQPKDADGKDLSKCLSNADSCATFGRFYDWQTAVESVCPEGWRLPTEDDWRDLNETVYTTAVSLMGSAQNMGYFLASTKYWNDGAGLDIFGMDIRPAGYFSEDGEIVSVGYGTNYWGNAETEEGDAGFVMDIFEDSNDGSTYFYMDHYGLNKTEYASVRCVKGAPKATTKFEERVR